MRDVRWTQCGHDNDVRGSGLTAHSRKKHYEWVIIHETWPVQKVQSKDALSSSDCTTMIPTTLWSSSHECLHGRYTGWSPPPYVIIVSTWHPPDFTHVTNETRPSSFLCALPPPCIILNANWAMTQALLSLPMQMTRRQLGSHYRRYFGIRYWCKSSATNGIPSVPQNRILWWRAPA